MSPPRMSLVRRTTTPHWRSNVFVVAVGILLLSSSASAQSGSDDPAIDVRVDSLLKLMTLAEKIGQLSLVPGEYLNGKAEITDRQREEIRRGGIGSMIGIVSAELARSLQRTAIEESRCKIPMLFGLDVIHGFRTVFPIPLAEASTWDPVLIEQAARVASSEASAAGINWTYGPMVDIARDPRWGRIAEGSGEDPYLGSVMARAQVRGFQGSDLKDSTTVLACAKHYVAYGGAEAGRDYNTVDISERTLREVYLPPFHAAVDAGAGSLMSAFNEIGGIPSSVNPHTLTDILRGEWGFQGFVVSDWSSVAELIPHGIAGDSLQAGLSAIRAGVDMDMAAQIYGQFLPGAIRDGSLSIDILDRAVRRVLREKVRMGLFERPYRNASADRETTWMLTPQHRALARRVAQESMVLLRNEGGLLPLSGKEKTIAVIGPLAADSGQALGPWDGFGKAQDVVSLLRGIRLAAPPTTRVLYAQGCSIGRDSAAGIADAKMVVAGADLAIVVLGEAADMSGEAASRSDIGLPGAQEELLRAVCATGTPVVLVLMNGRPLTIPWAAEHVPAILEAWFPGVEAGHAVADILYGVVNPSGKLPVTFPRSVGQVPLYYDHKNTGRPVSEDDKYTSKYLDIPVTPLYPFGYGLSYTTFSYGNLRIRTPIVGVRDTVRVSIEVTNTGRRDGEEIVQLYVRDDVASVTRPVKELKGFQRIALSPGKKQSVEFALPVEALGLYDAHMQYVVEPGRFTVFVGGSSVETLAGPFDVKGN
jgi:beta-glucosidase